MTITSSIKSFLSSYKGVKYEYLGVKSLFFVSFFAIFKQSRPLTLITAIEPIPWAVAIAAIVSVELILFSY